MSSDGLCKIGNAWWVARHVWYHTEYEGSPHDKDGLEPTPMKGISMRAFIYEEVPHVALGMGLCNMTHTHDTCILFLLLKP